MITRCLWRPLALLLLVASCGESASDRDLGDGDKPSDGDGGGTAQDASSGSITTDAAAGLELDAAITCSLASDCPTPTNTCVVAVCNDGSCATSNQADGLACDDGDACSASDTCVAGQCTGGDLVTCEAKSVCHEVGTCDPGSGLCSTPVKQDGTLCSETAACRAAECLEPVVVLAKQDFELTPATPTWTFTGTPSYNSGVSSETAGPANSPLGIGGSRAWETTGIGAGVTLDLDNVAIPSGFDSVRLRFRLAAMNLSAADGGPDDLDYVLVSISLDGGLTFYDRLRIKGSSDDNSIWGYDATGIASVSHLPMSVQTFQPVDSGLQTTLGYSTGEILFDNSITQLKVRLKARSSSTSDTWLIDDVVLTAERDLSSL